MASQQLWRDGASAVGVAGNRDRDAIAAMLARAFIDDPAIAFIFPDPDQRARRLPRLFRLLFDADATAGMRLVTAGGEAATLWRGPGRLHVGPIGMLRQIWPMWSTFGTAIGRALSVANAVEDHFPRGDHWYLHIAGCDPSAQGKGFGGMAVRSGLDRIAASGLPTYLETANEANIGYYQMLGFHLTSKWRVPNGGPLFWSMLHDPHR